MLTFSASSSASACSLVFPFFDPSQVQSADRLGAEICFNSHSPAPLPGANLSTTFLARSPLLGSCSSSRSSFSGDDNDILLLAQGKEVAHRSGGKGRSEKKVAGKSTHFRRDQKTRHFGIIWGSLARGEELVADFDEGSRAQTCSFPVSRLVIDGLAMAGRVMPCQLRFGTGHHSR